MTFEFNLRISQEDLQLINAGLGELPAKMVIPLINKLNPQIQEQIKAQMPQQSVGSVQEIKLKEVPPNAA